MQPCSTPTQQFHPLLSPAALASAFGAAAVQPAGGGVVALWKGAAGGRLEKRAGAGLMAGGNGGWTVGMAETLMEEVGWTAGDGWVCGDV